MLGGSCILVIASDTSLALRFLSMLTKLQVNTLSLIFRLLALVLFITFLVLK